MKSQNRDDKVVSFKSGAGKMSGSVWRTTWLACIGTRSLSVVVVWYVHSCFLILKWKHDLGHYFGRVMIWALTLVYDGHFVFFFYSKLHYNKKLLAQLCAKNKWKKTGQFCFCDFFIAFSCLNRTKLWYPRPNRGPYRLLFHIIMYYMLSLHCYYFSCNI